MPTIACICEKCGTSFYTKDEMYQPMSKNPFRISKKQKEILKTVQTLIDGSPSIYSPSSYYQNCMICEKDIINNLLSTIILKN